MLGIPEWAVGVGVIIFALFPSIALMIRLLPPGTKRSHLRDAALEQQSRLEELERRIGEVEDIHSRVAELEERLDFAERLLARQREAERLAPPPE